MTTTVPATRTRKIGLPALFAPDSPSTTPRGWQDGGVGRYSASLFEQSMHEKPILPREPTRHSASENYIHEGVIRVEHDRRRRGRHLAATQSVVERLVIADTRKCRALRAMSAAVRP
jgi:hypothetical protein